MKTDNLARPIISSEDKQSPLRALVAPPATQTEQAAPDNSFDLIDKTFQAHLGQMTSGISPAAMMTVYCSWLSQLAQSPGRMLELAFYPVTHWQDSVNKILGSDHPADDADPRFKGKDWQQFPWRLWAESFHQAECWWRRGYD